MECTASTEQRSMDSSSGSSRAEDTQYRPSSNAKSAQFTKCRPADALALHQQRNPLVTLPSIRHNSTPFLSNQPTFRRAQIRSSLNHKQIPLPSPSKTRPRSLKRMALNHQYRIRQTPRPTTQQPLRTRRALFHLSRQPKCKRTTTNHQRRHTNHPSKSQPQPRTHPCHYPTTASTSTTIHQ